MLFDYLAEKHGVSTGRSVIYVGVFCLFLCEINDRLGGSLTPSTSGRVLGLRVLGVYVCRPDWGNIGD